MNYEWKILIKTTMNNSQIDSPAQTLSVKSENKSGSGSDCMKADW